MTTTQSITFDFEGKVALVTGASKGIGAAVALLLGRSNATCAVNFLSSEATAKKISDEINSLGGRAIPVKCDVSDPKQVQDMFALIEKELGVVELLVNNAGVRADSLTHSMSLEVWERSMRINLLSTFLVTREALKGMLKKKFGRIVSVSSVAGTVGSFGQSNYAAAKAGLCGFSKSIAVEYGRKNIRANTVIPGIIETDMIKDMKQEVSESLLSQIPVGRFGRPEEVAYPVCFLLSEGANYINGATLHINGGGLRL